ncbi:MAG: PIN domain-containing protein [Atopobiaceae bacterium]|nr:PIN domain-containing protein [Atopobiaceae bacterium]
MFNPKVLLIDTSVWLEYLLAIEPNYVAVVDLFDVCVNRDTTIAYTPNALKDVFYLIPRQLRREAIASGDDSDTSYVAAAWACVRTMTEIALAVPQSLAECDLAWMLRNKHNDLEDNLLIASAETCHADYVVTYDKQLLERFPAICITPQQALDLFLQTAN